MWAFRLLIIYISRSLIARDCVRNSPSATHSLSSPSVPFAFKSISSLLQQRSRHYGWVASSLFVEATIDQFKADAWESNKEVNWLNLHLSDSHPSFNFRSICMRWSLNFSEVILGVKSELANAFNKGDNIRRHQFAQAVRLSFTGFNCSVKAFKVFSECCETSSSNSTDNCIILFQKKSKIESFHSQHKSVSFHRVN